LQRTLAQLADAEPAWCPQVATPLRAGGVFVAEPLSFGEPALAAAVILRRSAIVDSVVVRGMLQAPYAPGLLAMRQGALLQQAVDGLRERPDVLLVNASGRDHPRGAGLALHLGAVCRLPTIGLTDRPLLATFTVPPPERGAASELRLDGRLVGYAVRTRTQAKPVLVHAAWRVDADTARDVVLSLASGSRTPAPLREARRLARTFRSARG
jgi:deoxyribonuclease V